MTHPFLSRLTLKQRIRMLYRERDSWYTLGRYVLVIPAIAALVTLTASRHYVYISDSSASGESLSTEIPAVTIQAVEQPTPQAGTYRESEVQKLTPDAVEPPTAETTPKADDRKISGRVVDAADNEPLPGAAVVVTGTNIGTTTNANGFYTLTIPSDSRQISISFVGFIAQTVPVRDKDRIDAALSMSRNEIEELVVIGYSPVKATPKQAEAIPTGPSGEFLVVETMPEFPGGSAEMFKYLAKNIRYPAEAVAARIQGKIYIAFTINKSGYIRNPTVLQGLGYGTDEEAIRLVTSMPRWKPAKQDQVPVDVRYTLPISFVLDLKEEENKQGYAPRHDAASPESETQTNAMRIQIRGAVETLPEGSYFPSRYELSHLLDKPRMGFSRDENAPLYLVDGKEKYGLDGLDANTIASITVLKKGNLVPEYGPRAKNGVVLITLKKQNNLD